MKVLACITCLCLTLAGCQTRATKGLAPASELMTAVDSEIKDQANPIRQAGYSNEVSNHRRSQNTVNHEITDNQRQPISSTDVQNQAAAKMPTLSQKIQKSQTLAESFLFQPLKYPRGFSRFDLEGQRVIFTSEDGTKLDGRYFHAPNSSGVIVFCHGNAGNLASRTPRMEKMKKRYGHSVFLFDYRGYGRSEGKPTISGVLADARAAVKQAAKLANVDPSRVIVMGRSLGGAIAVHLAKRFQSPKLIIESSFTSFREIAKHHVGFLNRFARKTDLTSEKDIVDFRGQVLISHGTRDRTIPLKHAQRLYEAANEPKLIYEIENAGHNDPLPEAYHEVLGEFLKRS